MDPKEMERLKEEQLAAIAQTEERITKLEKYKNDYIQLKERLVTLPDKVSYDVMGRVRVVIRRVAENVPFGKLAFMPGRLVHTNEITVLLGDNWFAEVSAKDAIGITGQRVTDIERQIAELNKQKGLLQPRVDFTSELQGISENAGGLVEIKEDYDAEKEKAWRERHAENVRRHKQGTGKGEDREATGEDVWKRLEALETRELAQDELRSSSQSEESDDEGRPCERKKSVTWEDEQEGTSSEDSSGEDSEEADSEGGDGDTDGEERGLGSVIHFSHSKPVQESHTSDSSSDRDDDTATFRSPADIYKRYIETRPAKSILRTSAKSRQQHVEAATLVTTPVSMVTSDRAEAFSGEVIERGGGDVAETLSAGHLVRTSVTTSDQEQVTRTEISPGNLPQLVSVKEQVVQQDTVLDSHQVTDTVTQAQPKRVSKFRAQRMQNDAGLDSQQLTETVNQVQPKRVSKFRAQRMQQETNR